MYTDITALTPEEKMLRYQQLNNTPNEGSYLNYTPNQIAPQSSQASNTSFPTINFASMIQDQLPNTAILKSKDLPKVEDKPSTSGKDPYGLYDRPAPVEPVIPNIPHSSVTPSQAAKDAYDYYVNTRKIPIHVAAGIVGNLYRESDMKTSALGDSGNAHGLAQWSNSGNRWNNMQAWAKSKGKNPMDFTTQLDYVLDEPGEQAAIKATMATNNVHDAVMTFANKYERPNSNPNSARYDIRNSIAEELLK